MKRYNEALELMHNQKYEEAQALLESLCETYGLLDNVKWLLGLSYLYTGYPKKTLIYWRTIKDVERFEVAEKLTYVEQLIPFYDNIYAEYNEALQYIQQQQYAQSFAILKPIFETGAILPTSILNAYIFTAILLRDKKIINMLLEHCPEAVEKMQRTDMIEEKMGKRQKRIQKQSQEQKEKKNQYLKVAFEVMATASVIIWLKFYK